MYLFVCMRFLVFLTANYKAFWENRRFRVAISEIKNVVVNKVSRNASFVTNSYSICKCSVQSGFYTPSRELLGVILYSQVISWYFTEIPRIFAELK